MLPPLPDKMSRKHSAAQMSCAGCMMLVTCTVHDLSFDRCKTT